MTRPTTQFILDQLGEKNPPVLNLLALCRTTDYLHVWNQGPELLRRFARALLKQGHPTLALEVAARGLSDKAYPLDHELMYCRALALARSGNPTRAANFVEEMLSLPNLPDYIKSDTLSLAGRIRKDFALRTPDPAVRVKRFREAFQYYQTAFELTGDTFPGINSATLALLSGDSVTSVKIATEVRDRVLDDFDKPGNVADSWSLATLGEAYLLLGDSTAARGRYTQAVRLAAADNNDGEIAAMLKQIRLIRDKLPISDDVLAIFHLGPVVVFAGQKLDRPGEPVCFPQDPALETAVQRAIRNELEALETNIGYCTPSRGSEIIFGELMRQRNAELHVVLPFAESDFLSERVTYDLPELSSWKERYETLRGEFRVTKHFATTEEYLGDQVLYEYASGFMQGLALTRAAQNGVKAIALVVHDCSDPQVPSDLNTFITNWKKTGQELRIIDLATLRKPHAIANTLPLSIPSPLRTIPSPRRSIKSMLFADVAGFSGLPEPHLPAFFIEFLAIVKNELNNTQTVFQNTWGDGLYLVFEDVVTCAKFTLQLLKRLDSFDFNSFGLHLKEHQKPGVRIGLHTGPVFEGFDAIISRNNYFGSHVSRAARIEPVTIPGSAFVSEQFAAALAISTGHDFLCEYLGLTPLAKDYDICHLYRLTKKMEE